jgi:hypothetical protein
MKMGIVCGYGNICDENLKSYIDNVVKYACQNEISVLILTGGYTFTKSNISEAKLMSELVLQYTDKLLIYLEEESITTLHNLLYAKDLIEKLNLTAIELYIFCDTIRELKVKILGKIIFDSEFKKVVSYGRVEPLIVYLMQIPSILFQSLGAFFPLLAKKILVDKQQWINKYR